MTVSRVHQRRSRNFARPASESLENRASQYHGCMFAIRHIGVTAAMVALIIRSDCCASELSDVVASDSLPGASAGWKSSWLYSRDTPAREVSRTLTWPPDKVSLSDGHAVEINGTGERNNPLRRQLGEPFVGDELFVRFLLQYDADSIDTTTDGDGEFFVLWLDEVAGNDRSTHSTGVPNIGLHIEKPSQGNGRNVFMARIGTGHVDVSSIELKGDRTFMIVGRLSKSVPGEGSVFDSLDLWVDPQPDSLTKPHASTLAARSITSINAVGFATGRKTEPTDRIWIDELILGSTWESVLGLPPKPGRKSPRPSPASPLLRPMPTEQLVEFKDDVYPILKSRCFKCHSGSKPDSGYRLDVLDEVLGHSTGEPLAEPGKAADSRLVALITRPAGDDVMPPPDSGPPLTAEEITTLTKWIDQGLAWNDTLLPPAVAETDHWAFQRIERPKVPTPRSRVPANAAEQFALRNPIDAFLAEKYAALNLHPVGETSRRVLVRRLSLVLTGLPPTPEQIDAVVNASAPDAVDRFAVQLLNSPSYGERWGRHWLDIARYAESNGYQHNRDRPHAWRYRDYVVDSFNDDKPFDRFLLEQIAGDELDPYTDENLIATGFLAAARYSGNEKDKLIQRNDILVDITNATAGAVLGLTFGCAQCHSHKFDPVSARDYYRFQAFFMQGQPVNVVMAEDGVDTSAIAAERSVLFDRTYARLFAAERRRRPKGDIFILPKNVRAAMPRADKARYEALGKQLSGMPQTWAFYSPVTASSELPVDRLEIRWPLPHDRNTLLNLRPKLLVKGSPHTPGPVVSPGWPAIFGPVPGDAPMSDTPRTVLARWLTSRDNPLTARVLVNRIWQWHFGQGLVQDAANFGVQSPEPPLRELLDWLAVELIESGWSIKHIHRLIVGSSVYRQASRFDAANDAIDPDNLFFWRWLPRRLEAEAIRDSILTVTGELSNVRGGRSVTELSPGATHRRSLYLQQKRKGMPHMQSLFDGPTSITSCTERQISTVPLQPLFLLNSTFMQERAKRLAARVSNVAQSDTDQIAMVFRLTLGRYPTNAELQQLLGFAGEAGSLTDICLALLNVNEFVYLP